MGCILGELLHCLTAAASPGRSSRILFCFQPNCFRPINRWLFYEDLGKFFPVLGEPSQQDVEEYARAAGEAAVSKVPATASDAVREPARRHAVEEMVEFLTTGYKTLRGSFAPVDLAAKYSAAHAECPAAVALLLRMLTYSPSKRISCSQALRHQFLNPDGADVAAVDDGHEQAECSADRLQQLDIDRLCYRNRRLDRDRIYAFLMTEAQALKFCDRMPLALAAASALFVFSHCRVPAHVLQRPALQTTMLSQRWRVRVSLQRKLYLGNERLQLLCCGCPLSALLLRLATVVDYSGRPSTEHVHVICIMRRYFSGVARRLWKKCGAAVQTATAEDVGCW